MALRDEPASGALEDVMELPSTGHRAQDTQGRVSSHQDQSAARAATAYPVPPDRGLMNVRHHVQLNEAPMACDWAGCSNAC